MTDDASFGDLERVAETLIKRGFARKFIFHEKHPGNISFEFTGKGLNLQKQLLELFDVPNTNPENLNTDHVLDCVMAILLMAPGGEVANNPPKTTTDFEPDERLKSLLKELHGEINTMARLLVNNGWLYRFSWEIDLEANPINFNPFFSEQGKSNLCAIHREWNKSGLESLADMERENIPHISELGRTMTDENLDALSILAAVCAKIHGNAES